MARPTVVLLRVLLINFLAETLGLVTALLGLITQAWGLIRQVVSNRKPTPAELFPPERPQPDLPPLKPKQRRAQSPEPAEDPPPSAPPHRPRHRRDSKD